MKPVSILIVEDKSIIAESLAATLTAAGYIITGKTASGEEALLLAEKETPDLVLMDIHLSGQLDGIETVEMLKKKIQVPVIYLTDFHDQETIDRAKHTNPAAYLLKPYQEKELLVAVEIAFHNASTGKTAQPGDNEKNDDSAYVLDDRFFIKEKDILWRINISDVLWIEAGGSYCKIRTVKKNYTQSISLGAFCLKFNHIHFVRVHRSFVVNIDKVVAIKGNMLVIADAKEEIPVGETYREEVNRRLLRI